MVVIDEDDNEQSITPKRQLSEYELTKQKNIAENKLILSQIKADFNHAKLVEASKRNAQVCGDGKKREEKGKAREKHVTDLTKRLIHTTINKCIVVTSDSATSTGPPESGSPSSVSFLSNFDLL